MILNNVNIISINAEFKSTCDKFLEDLERLIPGESKRVELSKYTNAVCVDVLTGNRNIEMPPVYFIKYNVCKLDIGNYGIEKLTIPFTLLGIEFYVGE